jgi:hypothetical protein
MSTSSTTDDAPEWVPVNFEKAVVLPGEKPGSHILKVTGQTPSASGDGCPVKLEPAVYIVQPDYWRIEILWNRHNAIFQSLCPYTVTIPLDRFRGKKGIEVVGESNSEKITI